MKNKPFVVIPQNTVCVPLSDVLFNHAQLSSLRTSNVDMEQQIRQKDYRIAELEAQVSELEQKNAELGKDVKDKGDSVLYWFNKYQSLCNELEKVKPNAEAKTT